MPELPEVETTKNGLLPHIINQTIAEVRIHKYQLRYAIDPNIGERLRNSTIDKVYRRAKYIIWQMDSQKNPYHVLWHLGMSGSMRILAPEHERKKHDHVEIVLGNDKNVIYHDPRRFGCLLLIDEDVEKHRLIANLGPEPLSENFSGNTLFSLSKSTRLPVKQFIMNQNIVVGVGNIYASEALFLAKISPKRAANRISAKRYDKLAEVIKEVLARAIAKGGTTLRDFVSADGQPGYFSQTLNVYNQTGKPCPNCGNLIIRIVQQNRASFYCSQCQN